MLAEKKTGNRCPQPLIEAQSYRSGGGHRLSEEEVVEPDARETQDWHEIKTWGSSTGKLDDGNMENGKDYEYVVAKY